MHDKILENPLSILDNPEVVSVLKKHWKANHENLTAPGEFVEDFFAYLQEMRQAGPVDSKKISKTYNKKLKEFWQAGLGLGKPRDMFLEIIERELAGVETILDFGCGKLAFLKELAENDQRIKKLIGIDLKSRPILDGLDRRIEFWRDIRAIQKESVDVAVIKLVLHHVESEEAVGKILQNIQNVLRPGGKLIVFEESFPETNSGTEERKNYLAKFGMELSEVTADFLQLSLEDKTSFLYLNDWLMNVQNSYMPWTGLYKSIEEWKALAESVGFKEHSAHFLGAIKHRKRKQGMTAYMVWKK